VFDGSSFTLLDLAPATVFFAEQPGIAVGYLPTGPFLDRWYAEGSGARTRAVSAVLSFLDPDMAQAPEARLLLSLPRIRGTGMEYQARVVAGDVPSSAGACVLFISPPVTPATPGTTDRSESPGRPSSTGMVEPSPDRRCESEADRRSSSRGPTRGEWS
jgi:hypothetical protein